MGPRADAASVGREKNVRTPFIPIREQELFERIGEALVACGTLFSPSSHPASCFFDGPDLRRNASLTLTTGLMNRPYHIRLAAHARGDVAPQVQARQRLRRTVEDAAIHLRDRCGKPRRRVARPFEIAFVINRLQPLERALRIGGRQGVHVQEQEVERPIGELSGAELDQSPLLPRRRKHRLDDVEMLAHAPREVIEQNAHRRAFAHDAIVVELVRDEGRLVRKRIHIEMKRLVFAEREAFVVFDAVIDEKRPRGGRAPCERTRLLFQQNLPIEAVVDHIARTQAIDQPRIAVAGWNAVAPNVTTSAPLS